MTIAPVAILLGAGASLPYGIPLMSGLYEGFREHIARRHPKYTLLIDKFVSQRGQAAVDLETLMTDLQVVRGLHLGLTTLGEDTSSVDDQITLARELRGYLDAFIVDTCERFDPDRAARELACLLELRSFGPLWIFTTNYDRIVETVCEAHGVECSDGFEASGDSPVADWCGRFELDVRLVKLHGSVNWYVAHPGGGIHRLDRGYALPTHEFSLVREQRALRQLMIIPTLEKDVLGTPYIALATAFTDVLSRVRLLLIVGNSLRDQHIRGYVNVRLPNIHVLIVSPNASYCKQLFQDDARVHTLELGSSEFLTIGRVAFTRLVKALSELEGDEAAEAAAIDGFVRELSSDSADQEAILSHPALAEQWKATREGGVAARARATAELSNYHHPAVFRRLREILGQDSAPAVRVAAVSALLRLDPDGNAQTIGHALLTDPAAEVQLEAVLALRALGGTLAAGEWIRRAASRTDLAPAVGGIIEEVLATRGSGSLGQLEQPYEDHGIGQRDVD